VVLLGMAAASAFDPGFYLGESRGLLGIPRDQFSGYSGPEIQTLTAEQQIPLIADVLKARIASGAAAPKDVPDLAVIIHRPPKKIEQTVRDFARTSASNASHTRLYRAYAAMLQRVKQGD
jgi:hypothetical protein